jgi:hypothetical protein
MQALLQCHDHCQTSSYPGRVYHNFFECMSSGNTPDLYRRGHNDGLLEVR